MPGHFLKWLTATPVLVGMEVYSPNTVSYGFYHLILRSAFARGHKTLVFTGDKASPHIILPCVQEVS